MAVNSFREDEQMKSTDKKKIVRRLLSYLNKHVAGIIVVLVAMAISVGISLVNPLIIENAIDNYIGKNDWNGLLRIGAFTVVLNVFFIRISKSLPFI